MTYRNNPDRDFRALPDPEIRWRGYRGIMAAALAVLLVVGGLIYALTNRNSVAPSADNRPALGEPGRTTTGIGASTAPAKPFPAPAAR